MGDAQTLESTSERSAHAIYGLVIITSALVADRELARSAAESLLVLWGAGAVLLLAHLYSALVAEVGVKGRFLSHAERHLLITDNMPLLAAVVLPSVLIVLAGVGALSLSEAIDLSIAMAVVAFFVVGALQARSGGGTLAFQLGIGILGAIMGVILVGLEVVVGH
jgi:hypothetical protein